MSQPNSKKSLKDRVPISMIRYIKGVGPSIDALVEAAKTKKIILRPRAYQIESYYIVTDDSNIISAAKRVGSSSIDILVIGGYEELEYNLKKYIRGSINDSNFGGKEIAKTLTSLQNTWDKLFHNTAYEKDCYSVISQALNIPKEVLERALKTRLPTGIIKEDLHQRVLELQNGLSNVKKIGKSGNSFCSKCGSTEKVSLSTIDPVVLPHYINAAILTKMAHLMENAPLDAQEACLRMSIDSLKRLLRQLKYKI